MIQILIKLKELLAWLIRVAIALNDAEYERTARKEQAAALKHDVTVGSAIERKYKAFDSAEKACATTVERAAVQHEQTVAATHAKIEKLNDKRGQLEEL